MVGPRDKLHRHAERALGDMRCCFGAFQCRQHGRAGIPRHTSAGRGDIVPIARAYRDRSDGERSQLAEQPVKVGDDLVEHSLIEIDQVHLVHGEHKLADAQQRCDGRVATRLHQQALARIDQQDRNVGLRRAGDHVTGVLLVSRRIGQDEPAPGCLEEPVGDVDGDALVALGRKAIHQKRIVGAARHRAEADAVALQRRHHVVRDRAALEQQPPDQGGLAVIDRATGKNAQKGIGHSEIPLALLHLH